MKKKIGLMVTLAVLAAGTVFAQEAENVKAAVSLDLFPLFKGVIFWDNDADNSLICISPAVEFRAAPHISFAAVLDLYSGKFSDTDIFYWAITGHARYYPASEGIDGFFLDAGLGFNSFSVDKTSDYDFKGLIAILKMGYKVMPKTGFFVEPSLSYVYSKTVSALGGASPLPLGLQPGLAIGIAF